MLRFPALAIVLHAGWLLPGSVVANYVKGGSQRGRQITWMQRRDHEEPEHDWAYTEGLDEEPEHDEDYYRYKIPSPDDGKGLKDGYRPKERKEGDWLIFVGFIFFFVLGCFVIFCYRPRRSEIPPSNERIRQLQARSVISRGQQDEPPVPEPPPPAEEFIQSQTDDVVDSKTITEHLSGKWRGFVEQYHRSTNCLCEFTLVFEDGHVRGNGVDDVGAYSVTGLISKSCRRIAFSKRYIPESKASNGKVNYEENLGHVVEYRGVGAGPEVSTSGLRGTWYIQTSQYTGQGIFHIWPVEGLRSAVAVKASEDFLSKHRTFEISDENICVVCFDHTIDVLLDPCGHIVVCASCAQSLNPHRCPICRSSINQILSSKDIHESVSSEEP